MAKTRVKTKYIPSNKPYIVVGILWIILMNIFNPLKLSSLLLSAGICLILYKLMRKLKVFNDIEIKEEEEIPYQELETMEIIETGEKYLASFENYKQRINKRSVKMDIDEIVRISLNILKEVKNDPKDAARIRKFISYYLPMIDKMLKSYDEYEKGAKSEQIDASMAKIENMLKTVQTAFTSLYDSLHEEEAIDISSDIKVMEQMMAQEGYLDK